MVPFTTATISATLVSGGGVNKRTCVATALSREECKHAVAITNACCGGEKPTLSHTSNTLISNPHRSELMRGMMLAVLETTRQCVVPHGIKAPPVFTESTTIWYGIYDNT
jgi:hypothetical protein